MTQDTIKQRLRAARALIDTPEKWTKGAFQRDETGNEVVCYGTPLEPQSHCSTGAIMSACHNSDMERSIKDEREVLRYLGRSIERHSEPNWPSHLALTHWNDHPGRTHAEVMLAFDLAIEEASRVEV